MHRPWAVVLASVAACAPEQLRRLAGSALIEPQGASMLRVLSVEIGPRIPGTEACTRAEGYIVATHAVLLHQLLESEAPLAPRLGPDEVRGWVTRERFEPDAWMMDRGDLLGAR